MSMRDLVKISEVIKKIDHDGDPITFSKQTEYFGHYMVDFFQTDEDIQTVFQHLNKLALEDEELAINIANVLSSHTMEGIQFKGSQTTVRNEILRILQTNFMNHQSIREETVDKSYNAITLLGEFYNRLRIGNLPISILGSSLLQLLNQELQDVLQKKITLRPSFAKLVLTQITLNGFLFKRHEMEKLIPVLNSIRKVVVEAKTQEMRAKAYLMMTLDLFYSNFTTAALLALQKTYAPYVEQSNSPPAYDPFAEDENQQVPEKKQRVEIAVQTEVAISDVFRAGPPIVSPVERLTGTTMATMTCTNVSSSSDFKNITGPSPTPTPPSPSATNSSGTRKSKIDPKIRNVRIGRVYPSPVNYDAPPPRRLVSSLSDNAEVGKLSIANVTRHEIATMKENPSRMNRIKYGYLDRLVPPSEDMCPPSIKSLSEYAGKENELEKAESVLSARESLKNGGGGSTKKGSANKIANKIKMEENIEGSSIDPSYFDDYVPHEHAASKSFLQFLGNK